MTWAEIIQFLLHPTIDQVELVLLVFNVVVGGACGLTLIWLAVWAAVTAWRRRRR